MASITDCVVEGLKYPFNDIKKLLSFGTLFAVISLMSVFISVKSFDIFRVVVEITEKTNATASSIPFSQLPSGNIYLVIALAIVSFIISLFILGYQYDVLKFSIEKKEDLPGFGNILEMFINGIKYFIVILAYYIIPALLMVIGLTLSSNPAVLGLLGLISAVLFIVAFFLQIMALNNMVAHDSIKKAFDFSEIIDNIANLGWGKYIGIVLFALVTFIIIMIAAGIVMSFLTAIFALAINQAIFVSAFIGVIEGLFVNSYGSIFYSRVCGSIYRESIK